MNEIRKVVKRAAFRLTLMLLAERLVWCATAAVLVAIVLRVLQRQVPMAVDWTIWGPSLAGGVTLVALVWTLVQRPAADVVARRVDEGADLKEALSTALSVGTRNDPWAVAVVESASRSARGVNVPAAVPFRGPRRAGWLLAALFAGVVAWIFVPARVATANAGATAKKEELKEAKADVAKAKEAIEAALAQAKIDGEAAKEALKALEQPQANTNPDEIRRSALRELSSVTQKLGDQLNKLEARTATTMRDLMKDLRAFDKGPLSELSKALQAGDMKAAQQAADKLAQALRNNQLNAEQLAELAKQAQQMKEQLDKLAAEQKAAAEQVEQDQQALQERLDKLGVKPGSLDPDKLKQALDKMDNLTPEQKKELLDAAKKLAQDKKSAEAKKQAAQKMQQMSECMGQCSNPGQGQQGQGGQQGEQGQGGQQAAEALDAMAQMLQGAGEQAANAEAAEQAMKDAMEALKELAGQCEGGGDGLGECEGGMGQGQFALGDTNRQGKGSGGPGKGSGRAVDPKEAEEKWKTQRDKPRTTQGPIISTMLVEGTAIKGEAKAQFEQAVTTAAQQATEAIEKNVLPREFHDAAKRYFGRMQDRTKASPGTAPTAVPAAAPAAPAAPPADGKK